MDEGHIDLENMCKGRGGVEGGFRPGQENIFVLIHVSRRVPLDAGSTEPVTVTTFGEAYVQKWYDDDDQITNYLRIKIPNPFSHFYVKQ